VSSAPRVTAVIPTFQHGAFVAQAVSSVLSQTYTEIETVVVDDGSTDDTSDVLRGFGSAIKVIRQPNRGLSAARNTGVEASMGELVAFLDADDLWLPTKIEKQVPRFEDDRVGLVGADIVCFDAVGEYPEPTLRARNLARGRVYPGFITNQAVIHMPTAVVRRECFQQIGYFDETLTSLEDLDMWHRISRRWAVDYVDEPLARYRWSAGQMSRNEVRMLVNGIRVREKSVAADPELLSLDRGLLDSAFFDLYLELARKLIKHGSAAAAREQLGEYRRRRGVTASLLLHWLASWSPVLPASVLWRVLYRMRTP
jgi:glycosyltransferase involved in cell wall biosynthesis